MNVQQLINELEKIEDKSLQVVACDVWGRVALKDLRIYISDVWATEDLKSTVKAVIVDPRR